MKNWVKLVCTVMASFLFLCMLVTNIKQSNIFATTKVINVKNQKLRLCGFTGSYTGKLVNEKPNGHGEFRYKEQNNSKYGLIFDYSEVYCAVSGNWQNGILKGKAKKRVTFENYDDSEAIEYVGTFKNFLLNGKGQVTHYHDDDSPITISGNFINGNEDGYCITKMYDIDDSDGKIITFGNNYKNGVKIITLDDYNKIKIDGQDWIIGLMLGDYGISDEIDADEPNIKYRNGIIIYNDADDKDKELNKEVWKFKDGATITLWFNVNNLVKKEQTGLKK